MRFVGSRGVKQLDPKTEGMSLSRPWATRSCQDDLMFQDNGPSICISHIAATSKHLFVQLPFAQLWTSQLNVMSNFDNEETHICPKQRMDIAKVYPPAI